MSSPPKHVAVVGSGISGLATAYLLAKAGWKVTILEREDRLGGHSWTYHQDGAEVPPVDLGFQVFNFTTYPYLTAFLDELGVDHEPSDMSFAVSVNDGKLEWASHGLASVFAQRHNAYDPSFLHMIKEMFRFSKHATEVLNPKSRFANATLGEYLAENGYGEKFIYEYLLPMTAAVWSVPNDTMLAFPVAPMVRFWDNHHLLNPLGERPLWRVVKDRSEQYVNKVHKVLTEDYNARVLFNTPVKSVKRSFARSPRDGATTEQCESVTVQYLRPDATVASETFDHVVLACHSNQALEILGQDANQDEADLLGSILYQPNDVYLHDDERQMPKLKDAWASWNVLDRRQAGGSSANDHNVCVTYWLNNLQNLPKDAPLRLCTLNPIDPIPSERVICHRVLEHPVFSTAAIDAQHKINTAQALPRGSAPAVRIGHSTNTWFAGAYLGYGFHEDGLRSAVAVAHALGASPRWANSNQPGLTVLKGPSPNVSWGQSIGISLFDSVASRAISCGYLRVMLPNGNELAFGRASPDAARSANEPVSCIRIKNLDMLISCIRDGDIGLGEAFMDDHFEVDDMIGLFDVLILNRDQFTKYLFSSGGVTSAMSQALANVSGLVTLVITCMSWVINKVGTVRQYLRHLSRDNTVAGSRRNIEEHYDLGNDMYELFLDDTMTYSSGIHTVPCGADRFGDQTKLSEQGELPLHEAQLAKLDAIIARAELKPTDHVLEIGCGWGSFAIRAASTVGCKVTGITISTEQLALANKRVVTAGLQDKVNLIICDYRKLGLASSTGNGEQDGVAHHYKAGSFDKIVSIEMLEAVGHTHLPEYFQVVDRMLKPNGKALIQVISMPNSRYEEYIHSSDFIRRHIFPGGHLPSMAALEWAFADTVLTLEDVQDIGPDYAVTLRMWRERFLENQDKIMALGYPASFIRKWVFYFAYCEAGFKNRYIYDWHLTFRKEPTRAAALINRSTITNKTFSGDVLVTDVGQDNNQASFHATTSYTARKFGVTEALLLVWLFACSCVVWANRGEASLLGVPAVMVLALAARYACSLWGLPTGISKGTQRATQWSAEVTSLLFSTCISLAMVVVLARRSSYNALLGDLIHTNPDDVDSQFPVVTPQMILLFTSGYYVADLATQVTTGLWKTNIARVSYLAGALIPFSYAIVKNTCLPYLTLFLLVEFNQVFIHLRGVMSMTGYQLQDVAFKCMWAGNLVSVVTARLLVHFVIFKMVLNDDELYELTPQSFYWGIAAVGMAVMNVYNLGIAIAILSAFKIDHANGWNTDVLLNFKAFNRSREELIDVMSSSNSVRGEESKKVV